MAAPKGNKFAGSRKGVKNKKTEQWESFCEYLTNGGIERAQQELHALEGKDFINAIIALLEFTKPKLARTVIVGDKENPITVNMMPVGSRRTDK
jgi:hypothetical protein